MVGMVRNERLLDVGDRRSYVECSCDSIIASDAEYRLGI